MAIRQIALLFREQFTGFFNFLGLEFDNLVSQINAALRGIGTWTAVPFVATNFTANGTMTWTVTLSQVATWEWSLFGKTMLLHLHVVGSSVGGLSNSQLRVLVPNAQTIYATASGSYHYRDNTTYGTGVWEALAGATIIRFFKQDRSNWAASTNQTDVRATLTLSVT